MKAAGEQLGLFDAPKPAMHGLSPDDPNVELIVRMLDGRDWITARQILEELGREANESGKRWLRAIADASRGRIAGGQHGYRLVSAMTQAEFQHWRNWMTHQAGEMQRRVLEADRVFFARKAV